MKAILIPIKPKWCAKIMNRDKTIEVRRNKALYKATMKLIEEQGYATFFMYCTKDKTPLFKYIPLGNAPDMWDIDLPQNKKEYSDDVLLNGKVVAKFTVRKVEEIENFIYYKNDGWCGEEQEHIDTSKMCLSEEELYDYLDDKHGYAYHIEDLVVFDKPRELSSFCKVGCIEKLENYIMTCPIQKLFQREMPEEVKQWVITKAPQNFVFVESEE